MKKTNLVQRKDFKKMTREDWGKLDNCIREKLSTHTANVESCAKAQVDAKLKCMNTCIQQAIKECVPDKKRLSAIKREISDETRRVYEERASKFSSIAAQGGKISKQLRKRWHRRIKEANLRDYNSWLDKMTTEMEKADSRGDTETIFRTVKLVSGLMTSSAGKAPTRDKKELILDQKKMAQVWQQFLEKKFAATEAEENRDPYTDLGPQLENDPLTEHAFVSALEKVKRGKACGPDGIPGEVFCNSEAAARELYDLLTLIWEREYVP